MSIKEEFAMNNEYNKYSKQQEKSLKIMTELVVQYLPNRYLNENINIADYGCSEGRNSIELIKWVIKEIRKRDGNTKFNIFFEDLESNNWSEIFRIANQELTKDACFYAVGKSFYERNFPKCFIDFGFSGNSFHWASQLLPLEYGFLMPITSMNKEEKNKWSDLSQRDWETILSHRSIEIKNGGILFANFAGFSDDTPRKPLGWLLELKRILDEFEKNGIITRKEKKSLILPIHIRNLKDVTNSELLSKYGFKVLHSKATPIGDPYYDKLENNIKNGMNKEKAIETYSKDISNSKRAYGEYFYQLMLKDRKNKNEILEEIFKEFERSIQKNHEKFKETFLQIFIVLQKVDEKSKL